MNTDSDGAIRGSLHRRVADVLAALALARQRRRRARAASGKSRRNRVTYGLTASLLVLLGLFGVSLAFLYSAAPAGARLSLDEVQTLAQQGRVRNATFLDVDNQVVGTFAAVVVGGGSTASGSSMPGDQDATTDSSRHGQFNVDIPSNGQAFQALVDQFRASRTRYTVDRQIPKQVVKTIASLLIPLMVLANLFALLLTAGRGGGGAIGEVMTFGTIGKGKAQGGSGLGFDDVGGADEAVAELREVRDYLTDPGKYQALGAAPPKGVLLFGPPGTGKTLLAKAVAGEAGVPFFSVAGAEFVESLVGVGAARVRDLFARVRAAAPAIVFIDELDAAGRKRGSGGGGGGSDEREQTLNQLLVEMDGFEVQSGIVVMAATNRPDIFDPALMRPGRFDRHITIERPEVEGRLHILRIHSRDKPIEPDVDLEQIARRTPGFTGADLASVMNEATLLAIRDARTSVTEADLHEAIQRVLNGPKRRGRVLTPAERRRTAYHEAGHVIVAAATEGAERVQRVSILSRGRTLGMASTSSGDDASAVLSRSQLRARLVTLMAGTAAEVLVLGESSTGAEQDIQTATELALEIAARFGMSDELGPVRLLAKLGTGFMGDAVALGEVSSETKAALDRVVRRMLVDAQAEAAVVLARHRPSLDALAERLDQEETLEGAALAEALAAVTLAPLAGDLPEGNGLAARPRRPLTTSLRK